MRRRNFSISAQLSACVLSGVASLAAQDASKARAPEAKKASCSARVELSRIWQHLCARYDKDADGRITSKEYARGATRFANFDRDRDGVLTAADFPKGRHFNGFSPQTVRDADRDRDGVVTEKEWRAFFAMLDQNKNGVVSAAEFGRIAGKAMVAKWDLVLLAMDQDFDGDFDRKDAAAIFADVDLDSDGKASARELEGWKWAAPKAKRSAPAVGTLAPGFELPRLDDPARTIALSSFRGKRPVALVFGSYT